MPATASNPLQDPAPHSDTEMAAGRQEGFGAVPLATRTCDQRVMAPLTMSSMGSGSPSSQPHLSGWGTVVLGRDLPPQMFSSVSLFLSDRCFQPQRGAAGCSLHLSSFAFTVRSGWKGCTEPDQPLALPLLPPQGQPGHSSCKTLSGQLPDVVQSSASSTLSHKKSQQLFSLSVSEALLLHEGPRCCA